MAGMLIRRVVPAMAATLAAYIGLAFAAGAFLRQHYLTLLVTSNLNTPVAAWITSQWFTKGGKFAFAADGVPAFNVFERLCPPFAPGSKPSVGPAQCFAEHGYTQWTSYQPASRFWPFQWIEGGWLLALSVLLIAERSGWSAAARPELLASPELDNSNCCPQPGQSEVTK